MQAKSSGTSVIVFKWRNGKTCADTFNGDFEHFLFCKFCHFMWTCQLLLHSC